MAGAFGYQAQNYDTSMAIGELGVLPAARKAGDNVHVVADGTSCRHHIRDGAARETAHVAVVRAPAQTPRSALAGLCYRHKRKKSTSDQAPAGKTSAPPSATIAWKKSDRALYTAKPPSVFAR